MGLGRKVKKERGNSNNVNGSLVGWLALTPEWFDVALPRRSNPNQIHICVLSKAETSTRWYMGCACCRYAPITVQTSIFAPKMTTKIKKSWRLNWHFGQTRERNSGGSYSHQSTLAAVVRTSHSNHHTIFRLVTVMSLSFSTKLAYKSRQSLLPEPVLGTLLGQTVSYLLLSKCTVTWRSSV